jgi:hypothetical protein
MLVPPPQILRRAIDARIVLVVTVMLDPERINALDFMAEFD